MMVSKYHWGPWLVGWLISVFIDDLDAFELVFIRHV